MKTFRGEFFKFYNKIKNGENFCLTRWSDGEEKILYNEYLRIDEDKVIFGDIVFSRGFPKEDQKLFNPQDPEDQKFRQLLLESFRYKNPNYYKGIICPCCVGIERYNKFLDFYGEKDEQLTFSNIWVNSNYDLFIDVLTPLFNNRKIIVICNEKSDINNLPFKVEKDFRVGDFCFIKNINLDIEIEKYILNNSVENSIFLFSASSLSNILIYKLYNKFKNNTYLNIGTCYNNYLGLSIERDYLLARWKYKKEFGLSHRNCILR